MSFISILKKAGQIILDAEGIEREFHPLLTAIPGEQKIVDRLEQLNRVVLDAEIMGQAIKAKGADKALMAAPAAFQILLDLPFLKNKKPKDPAKAKSDAANVGAALAEFLNNFEG